MIDLQPSAAEAASTNVSELRELVQRLSRAQQEYQELIDTIDGIVWETDANFRFLFVSRQAVRLLGYPVERWLEEPGFWAAHVHPDDRAWAFACCQKATAECRPHEFEYRMVAADGRLVWLRDIVTVISEGGRPIKLRGIMVDVTAQHEARESLERTVALLDTFLNNAPVGLGFLDTDLRYIRINDSLAALHGTSRDQVIGRRIREQIPRMAPIIEPHMRQVLETGAPIIGVDVTGEVPASPGQLRHWRVSYYPVKTPSEGIVGVGAVVVEVTAEQQAQVERERLLREAQEAIHLRDDFLSIAAHELKTPLTPLKLHLQALRQHAGSGLPLQPARMDKALSQVRRLSGLINDLLDVSRIEAGRLELERGPLVLSELVCDVVADFSPVCPQHRFECQKTAESLVILGDRGRLAQVLTNLLENAVKYSPMGGAVRVMIERRGAEAVVTVADSGIGIPVDQQEHLFERFFRARNAPISGFGGLGLGLYICRDIVQRHGGRIWVESELEYGSTFHVALPIQEPSAMSRSSSPPTSCE